MTKQFDDLLNLTEVCAMLRVKRSRVYTMLKDQKLRALKIGRSTVIARSEIDRFLASVPAAVYMPNPVRRAA